VHAPAVAQSARYSAAARVRAEHAVYGARGVMRTLADGELIDVLMVHAVQRWASWAELML
jgi:hypothetical protein